MIPRSPRSPFARYGVALLLAALALLLRWPLWPVLGADLPFLLFWPAIVLCACYGGLGPGLLATLLSSAATAFFLMDPRSSFAVARPADLLGLLVFAALGCLLSALTGSLRRAREDAAARQEQLGVTLLSIGDAVIATDSEGRVTFLNPVAERLTEWSFTEAVGRPLEAVFHVVNELTRAEIESPVRRVLREGQVVGLANHTTLLSRGGAEYAIDDSAAPIRDKQGRLVGVVLVFRDITARRRDEEALAASQRRLQTLFENAQDAILLANDEARYVDANPAACELLGLSRDEVLRRSIWDVTPLPNGDMGRKAWKEFLSAGKQSGEYRLLRADGGTVEVEYRAVANIQPGLHLSVLRDVGERKRLEEELRRRMAELAEADRHKDEFLAMLAHEMRGPLAPILTGVQILRGAEPGSPAASRAIDIVARQAEQLTSLVDDLLDVARVKQGKVKLRRRPVGLAEVVGQAVETCRPLIEARRHHLSVSLPESPVRLEADPVRLTQVFANLLNNSAKYTDEGGRVWLTAERVGDEVVVRVADTGVGIPAEMLPDKVFGLFAQVGASQERSQGGLGIGLSLVRSLVEMHGGTVTACSDGPGRGSTFTVRLPVMRTEEGATPGGQGREETTPGWEAVHRRVLVVDDNRDAADTLAALLRVWGHEVRVAYDGPGAVEVAAYRPEVVLLDISLPGGQTGYDVAQRLRQQGTVLVAMTGFGQEEDRRRAEEAGFHHFLIKPVDPEALRSFLGSLKPTPS